MLRNIVLMIAVLALCGCQALLQPAPTTRVRPEPAGLGVTMSDLQKQSGDYKTLYSGPVYNPSALLFVPREGQERLEPIGNWDKVEGREDLKHLKYSMDRLDPELWAIVPSGLQKVASEDVLAYIYTQGYASVQKIENTDRYRILPVEEQFNPIYHDRAFPEPGVDLFRHDR